jgi:lipopolysaccharide export LptBFGC system permease protein LptF
MERIVDPVLIDIKAEPARARWAGYLDLARALALNAISTPPRHWLGNDAAVLRRLAGLSAVFGLLLALLSNTVAFWPLLGRPGLTSGVWFLWLLPSTLAMSIPAALLIAVPAVLKDRAADRVLMIRALTLALIYAAALFVLVGWAVPEANQSFRTAVAGKPVPRGPGELSFAEARRDIGTAKTYVVSEAQLRRLEFTYHSRLSVVLAPVSLMMLALALARRTTTKRHPYRTGFLALLAYAVFIGFARGLTVVTFSRGSLSPLVLAWGPSVTLAVIGVLALYFSAIATPAKPWTTLPPPGSSNDLIS